MKFILFFILLCTQPLSYAQSLLIGTTPQNPPFSSIADTKDNFYGFDIDIMGAICQRIKAHCKFTPILFRNLATELAAGKIDIAIAAIIIGSFTENNFIYSLPYLESNAQFLSKKKSPIATPQDIINKKVGVRRGTPFKNLALTIYQNNITILEYDRVEDLLNALNDNSVDIMLTNAAAARYWFSNNSNLYKLIGIQIPTGQGYGIMTNHSQDKLIQQINQALLAMEADGTYLQIYSRYFGN